MCVNLPRSGVGADEVVVVCDCALGWGGDYCESCGPADVYEGEPFGGLGCWLIADRAEVRVCSSYLIYVFGRLLSGDDCAASVLC